jgi:hypothetical protein
MKNKKTAIEGKRRGKAISLLTGKTRACKELIEFFVDNYWPGLDDEDNLALFESYLSEQSALKPQY